MKLSEARAWWETNGKEGVLGLWIGDEPIQWREYDDVPHLVVSDGQDIYHFLDGIGGVEARIGYWSPSARNLALKEFPRASKYFFPECSGRLKDEGMVREYWALMGAVYSRYRKERGAAPGDCVVEQESWAKCERAMRALEAEFSDVSNTFPTK